MAIDLSTLNGTNGFVIIGDAYPSALSVDSAGWAVASAGDVDGDGFDDLLIGAPGGTTYPTTSNGQGLTYVVYGKASGFGTVQLSDIDSGDPAGFYVYGSPLWARSGYAVSGIGDINGDGFEDFIIGANGDHIVYSYGYDGQAYVVFGKAGGLTSFDASTLTSSGNGFRITGPDGQNDRVGTTVSGGGDINGDGFDDFIVMARDGDPAGRSNAGETYVFFGKAAGFADIDLDNLSASDGFRILGAAALDQYAGGYRQLGHLVSSLGDVNGDGFDDLLIGARYADPASGAQAGISYVVFGKASGFLDIDLAALNPADGFAITGAASDDLSGMAVADAGDLNGDGFRDLVVGAPYADNNGVNSGSAYVVFGKAAGFGTVDLTTLAAGTGGFRIDGQAANARTGISVATAGDLNGDGYDDLLVGGVGLAVGGPIAWVVFGKAGGINDFSTVDLSALGPDDGFALDGETLGRGIVASAGDVNGDGYDDLMVGDQTAQDAIYGASNGGRTYVVFGAASLDGSTSHVTLEGTGGDDTGAGALTGTAAADVIIGGRGNDELIGAGGADVLRGGEGDDALVIADQSFLRLVGGTGDDSLVIGGATTLADADFRRIAEIEDLTLGNFTTTIALGLSASQAIDGRAANDFKLVVGTSAVTSAAITLTGTAFGRALEIDLSASSGSATLLGTAKDDVFAGGGSGDTLSGGLGNDTLTGNGGGDLLRGGDGNDDLEGGLGHDSLDGGDGADTMDGGGGNDTYFVDDALDSITEAAGGGTDRVFTSITFTLADGSELENLGSRVAGLTLTGNNQANVLTGVAGIDTLIGGDGADTLDGRGGADQLEGGSGNDTYVIRSGAETIAEAIGDSADRLVALVDFTLAAGVAIERMDAGVATGVALTGNAFANIIVGRGGDDTLEGGDGNDRLDGLGGIDRLEGGADDDVLTDLLGGDTLVGGTGDDSYRINFATTTIEEDDGAGTDSVMAATTYTLGAHLEHLTLLGTGAYDGTGNALANRIVGNANANTLNGLDGNDWLRGGLRNDVLNGGADADLLQGEHGNDVLDGGAGADDLDGGIGHDSLTGGADSDTFVFSGAFGIDTITDFEDSGAESSQDGLDRIDLSGLRSVNGGLALTLDDLLMTNVSGHTLIRLDLNNDQIEDQLDLDGAGGTEIARILVLNTLKSSFDAFDFIF